MPAQTRIDIARDNFLSPFRHLATVRIKDDIVVKETTINKFQQKFERQGNRTSYVQHSSHYLAIIWLKTEIENGDHWHKIAFFSFLMVFDDNIEYA